MRRLALVLPLIAMAILGCQDPIQKNRENEAKLRQIKDDIRRMEEETRRASKMPILPCKPARDQQVNVSLPEATPDPRIILKKRATAEDQKRMVVSKAAPEETGPVFPFFPLMNSEKDSLINVGCDAATVEAYKGSLKVIQAVLRPEQKDPKDMPPSLQLGADTVLLCDDASKYLVSGAQIKGRTVLMDGFSYSTFFTFGEPFISADRLILRKSNSFIVQASPLLSTATAPIQVQVLKSLEGDGQLVVDSLGVNCPEQPQGISGVRF